MGLFSRCGSGRHENTTASTGVCVGKVSRDLILLNMSFDSETQVQAAAPPRVAGRPLER